MASDQATRDIEPSLGDVGEDPDARFTFANERTFLAWNRTALALIAAGAAAAAFLRTGWSGARLVVALPLIALGAVVAFTSYRRWEANERAMRLNEPIEYSSLPRVLGLSIGVIAVATAVIAVIDLVSN
ncbi:MAG: putative rane protein [Thermoleophilaceae bacterium]|nr:putative rane protein [Thermoleophilaceae bacterium]